MRRQQQLRRAGIHTKRQGPAPPRDRLRAGAANDTLASGGLDANGWRWLERSECYLWSAPCVNGSFPTLAEDNSTALPPEADAWPKLPGGGGPNGTDLADNLGGWPELPHGGPNGTLPDGFGRPEPPPGGPNGTLPDGFERPEPPGGHNDTLPAGMLQQ